MAQLRVLLGFADAADHVLEETASEVLTGLYANATIYPTPPVTAADLTTALTNFRSALAEQERSGSQGTAAKDQARAAVITLLRQLALYVQQVIQGNDAYGLAELLLSGFEAVSTNRAQQPLAAPAILEILNQGEGTVRLRVKPSANARMYEVQKQKEGSTTWEPAGLFSSTRDMIVGDLVPGALYSFRARALGGSTGQSDWSNPVSRRSL